MVIKTGLVGYGNSAATFHAPLLSDAEGFEVTKVMSSDRKKVLEDFPDVEVVGTLNALLKDEEIELIVITTPTGLHYHHAKKSILAGKHVVVEKPFTVTSEEAEELIALADEQDVVLSVFHNRRFDGDFLTAKKLIQDNTLGKISTYKVHFNRYRPTVRDRWREREEPGAGLLYDLGSHLIDQAIYLFGLPKFVTAETLAQRPGAKVDDYFHMIIGYNRLRVILEASSITPYPGPHIEVHGTKGSYLKYGRDRQEEQLKAGMLPSDAGYGSDAIDQYGTLVTIKDDKLKRDRVVTAKGSYQSYYQTLYKTIRQNYLSPVPAQDALAVIEVLEAAAVSSQEKTTVFFE
ncbi:scyllo-inositol 2-dehydrogenase (NADP+) [Bacillus ectoiniformans]|uniref:oxidoreductase n=1 Tax=Bacillus ectoiniformans TaxID=1494429 RepID=UPI00195A662D|nr:oxidoreductase [Bacillus ectoiniformans]MBM7649831.1 scyllo-inositol 2-dehydrogenase (NADP+) [Bacillus ectoiniformans]